jgi:RNA polymerase sigma-70 factor (ECF subfamily)
VREALSLLRRRELRGRHETPTDPERLERLADEPVRRGGVSPDGERTAFRVVVEKEQRERVEAAMGCLTDQQRAVFVLRFREGMEPREIAERLGMPAGQVRVQLHRAVARLREQLEESP